MRIQKRKNQNSRTAARARRHTAGTAGKLLIMLAAVAAAVFGVTIFFKVGDIQVQGNTIYSAEKIVEASQLQKGDNLLLINKATAAGNIQTALPYVEKVSIARSMPDTVIIQVVENRASFAVQTDTNTVWLIGVGGKALERIDAESAADYPQLLGFTIEAPEAGKAVTSRQTTALEAALSILQKLDGTGLLEHIASVDLSKEYDIVLQYDERYEILLGGTDELDYKLRYLSSILSELSEYQAGTIDLTQAAAKKATFTPKT